MRLPPTVAKLMQLLMDADALQANHPVGATAQCVADLHLPFVELYSPLPATRFSLSTWTAFMLVAQDSWRT